MIFNQVLKTKKIMDILAFAKTVTFYFLKGWGEIFTAIFTYNLYLYPPLNILKRRASSTI